MGDFNEGQPVSHRSTMGPHDKRVTVVILSSL